MGFPIFTFKEYINYKLRATNAHGLHSPFVFELYRDVINSSDATLEKEITAIRKSVFQSKEKIRYTDPKTLETKVEKIGLWASRVTSSVRFQSFLIRLINYLEIETVLETGTAAGINAACLSISNASSVITIEGSEEISNVALGTIQEHGKGKVQLITGKVKEVFGDAVNKKNPDLIFLDADHRSDTIGFYMTAIDKMSVIPKCVLIHDIYWSADMKKGWHDIIKNENFSLTLDLFEVGLIFPVYPIEKQHFTLQF